MLLAESGRVAGTLQGPENLYGNVTQGFVSKTGRLLPASKGATEDLQLELAVYKNSTDVVINSLQGQVNVLTGEVNILIAKVNSLTPVGINLQLTFHPAAAILQGIRHVM